MMGTTVMTMPKMTEKPIVGSPPEKTAEPVPTTTVAPPQTRPVDRDGADFASRAAAQAALDRTLPEDPDRRDEDGRACEDSFPGPEPAYHA